MNRHLCGESDCGESGEEPGGEQAHSLQMSCIEARG